jgi:hypothetical protein
MGCLENIKAHLTREQRRTTLYFVGLLLVAAVIVAGLGASV